MLSCHTGIDDNTTNEIGMLYWIKHKISDETMADVQRDIPKYHYLIALKKVGSTANGSGDYKQRMREIIYDNPVSNMIHSKLPCRDRTSTFGEK